MIECCDRLCVMALTPSLLHTLKKTFISNQLLLLKTLKKHSIQLTDLNTQTNECDESEYVYIEFIEL